MGTVESRSMGGLSVFSDSIHLNLQNPAGYAALRLTTYAIGGSHSAINLESYAGEEKTTNSNLMDYLAVGFPAGKLGFGFGLAPATSVGYELQRIEEDLTSKFSGNGGLNRVFLSVGYRFNEYLRIGASANYKFGNIQNKSLFFQDQIQFGTREINRSHLSGFDFKFGAQYQRMISENLQITGSADFSPSTKISSENQRQVATVILRNGSEELISDLRRFDVEDSKLTLPTHFTLGAGIGKPNNWFAGLEYGSRASSSFSNRSFDVSGVEYSSASNFALGGFYIPKYNDITNYFNRIVYRGGFRYEETGLNINNEGIDEFGISFGVGLPAGKMLSNLNIGFEYGQRGTTAAGLVKETFYNIFISLSLNDLWFQKSKYN
ncbi:MAG TPA: hypothetical protein VFM82_01930 [Flavobacteriaceae bacterium]|nr:hypothetical protein [Flavobacteriaceae bacterium]